MAAVTVCASGDFFDDDEAPIPSPMSCALLWREYAARPREAAPPVSSALWNNARLLAYHSEFVTLRTPVMGEAHRQLRSTLLVNNRHRGTARRGLIVSGPPGAGKSTTLMELGRSFERSERAKRAALRDYLPVVFAAIPPTCTPKGLVIEFARFLGIPVHNRLTESTITDAVCRVMVERRTRLVFIDDVHLLNTRTRPGADSSDQVKALAERVPATFVLAGVNVENSPLLTGPRGAQLAARFKILRTPPLLNGTAEQKSVWRKLLGDMELALRLRNHRPGTLVRHADLIHMRTGGVMTSLSALIREAAICAVDDGSYAITRKHLSGVVLDIQATNTERARRRPGDS
ncbi:TniB family NTP-binding protein [Streptomyces sp. NPDC058548]|uniref:TniB family NTP-binding protein n=1 Tax=Streptomyces sp. NPDC058548 TaxID=3346545 RepID=UPI00365752FC